MPSFIYLLYDIELILHTSNTRQILKAGKQSFKPDNGFWSLFPFFLFLHFFLLKILLHASYYQIFSINNFQIRDSHDIV